MKDEKTQRHPLLKDKPSGTLPKRTTTIYLKKLLQRSKEAVEKLKKKD